MLTRSEILSTCKNAARGAGFSWGMASEAAIATLALIEAGEDGFGPLIEILNHAKGKEHPLNIEPGAPICGLTLGVYLADLGAAPKPLPQGIVGLQILTALTTELSKGAARPDAFPPEVLEFAAGVLVPESELSRRQGAGEG
ncbi:MAG: DUF3726 domain-containing protein [Pseudomonadota bacterium]